jgi:FKBP-type peptidyl-prolyl cis-trans isomerase 2
MELVYRGAQTSDMERSRLGTLSFTPCLGAAIIWSSNPGGSVFSSSYKGPHFVDGSTVWAVNITSPRPLVLGGGQIFSSLQQLLEDLGQNEPNGITDDELDKLLLHLHKRATGRLKMVQFEYRMLDEDGEVLDETEELGLSFRNPQTFFSACRDGMYDDYSLLEVDTFAFADSKLVQQIAERLGYTSLDYLDTFGGASASEKLMGIEPLDIDCIEEVDDLDGDNIYAHETIRPLTGAEVEVVWQRPGAELAAELAGRAE